ncbi:hypothetical protein CAPTEDRAFT_199177 [Capitella teleta]|uniref:Uncharacterized protein n=1 Tax=Capitella teleta TaxID=283909 RepID=R7VDM6_CAPTE|nr:hypothetical protein CAPTEDRAFT_199177 [Capitella teleta]|eukprot:ELU16714.1 hypothetical protein CAPTEDRAFT_199177 [Capitella teleta]
MSRLASPPPSSSSLSFWIIGCGVMSEMKLNDNNYVIQPCEAVVMQWSSDYECPEPHPAYRSDNYVFELWLLFDQVCVASIIVVFEQTLICSTLKGNLLKFRCAFVRDGDEKRGSANQSETETRTQKNN